MVGVAPRGFVAHEQPAPGLPAPPRVSALLDDLQEPLRGNQLSSPASTASPQTLNPRHGAVGENAGQSADVLELLVNTRTSLQLRKRC